MTSPRPLAPRDLTIPEPGSTTAREVLSRSLGRLARDLAAIPKSAAQTAAGRADLEAFQARIAALIGGPPSGAAALLSALRSPTTAALLRSLRNELHKPALGAGWADGVLVELLATLAFELALAGALGSPLRLARLPRRILSLAARASLPVPAGAEGAVFADRRLLFEGAAVEIDLERLARGDRPEGVSSPFFAIDGGTIFAIDDNNPRAAFGAEPGEPGNPIDLGGHAPEAWTAPIREALALIAEFTPELRAEFELYIRLIFPAGHHAITHRSASYRESIGAIYMTLHPKVMTLAEALIHEFSHNKLHALFELDPVIENPPNARYRSPVRPDLRPLRGVLLAVHAFLPIAWFYERMASSDHPLTKSAYFHERFAQIRALNREGASVVLEHARPTAAGRALLDEIRRWIAHYDA